MINREEPPKNKSPISIKNKSPLQKPEESQFQRKKESEIKLRIEDKLKCKNGSKLANLKRAYFDKNFADLLSSESDEDFEREIRKKPKSPIFKKIEETDLFLSTIKRSGSKERKKEIPFEQSDMLSSAKRQINFDLELSYSRNSSVENERNMGRKLKITIS